MSKILEILALVLGFFVRRGETREQIRQRTAATYRELDADAQDIAHQSDAYEGLRAQARRDREAAAKPPAPPPPAEPTQLTLTGPGMVVVGEAFQVQLSAPASGAEVYADDWRLYYVPDDSLSLNVRLNTAGKRRIRIVREGKELAACVVVVE